MWEKLKRKNIIGTKRAFYCKWLELGYADLKCQTLHLCYSDVHNSFPPSFFLDIMKIIKIESHPSGLPSMVPCKFVTDFDSNETFFFEKKYQNDWLKKTEIFNSPNSQYFFSNISGIVSWVSRIDWCEGHWCGLIYMVVRQSDISSKMA